MLAASWLAAVCAWILARCSAAALLATDVALGPSSFWDPVVPVVPVVEPSHQPQKPQSPATWLTLPPLVLVLGLVLGAPPSPQKKPQ